MSFVKKLLNISEHFVCLHYNNFKDLIPNVYGRKQKQIELHVLPTLWSLLNLVKGNTTSNSSASALNAAIGKLASRLHEQMGDQLIDKAANSSSVSAHNLDVLKDLLEATY